MFLPFCSISRPEVPAKSQETFATEFEVLQGPQGSTGAQRYGRVPQSVANNSGEIPQKKRELQILCFEEFFWGESALGLIPADLPHALAPLLCTPPLPLSQTGGRDKKLRPPALEPFVVNAKSKTAVAVRNSLLEKLSANFDAAEKFFTDNAIPAKVWAFSGKEDGCWKIGPAFGNAPGFCPLRPPQPS